MTHRTQPAVAGDCVPVLQQQQPADAQQRRLEAAVHGHAASSKQDRCVAAPVLTGKLHMHGMEHTPLMSGGSMAVARFC